MGDRFETRGVIFLIMKTSISLNEGGELRVTRDVYSLSPT